MKDFITENDAKKIAKEALVLANQAFSEGIFSEDKSIARLITEMNVMDISFVDFTETEYNSEAAFEWDRKSKKIILNFAAVKNIILSLDDIAKDMEMTTQELHIAAVTLLLFHEANHVVQGLSKYRDVKTIKATGGDDLICELDIISDGVAARIYAGITLVGTEADKKAYYMGVYGSLSLSFHVLTKSFPFGTDKKMKIFRALSLLVMRERALIALQSGQLELSAILAVRAIMSPQSGYLIASTIECNEKQVTSVAELGTYEVTALAKNISLGDLEKAEATLRAKSCKQTFAIDMMAISTNN